jgi:hypothetical protein
MARKPTAAAPTAEKKVTGTAVANWDEQLAREAEVAAAMEANAGGGQFFSTQGGVLSFGGNPLPGNQLAGIIVDHILENVYYDGKFDPNNPSPPVCFAFGRDEATMAPHPTVVEAGQAQHPTCRGCDKNEWATADTGRGKACRNSRRLGIIAGGAIDPNSGKFTPITDPEDVKAATVGFLKIPVTSVKGFASFVKQIAGALRRPPHGIFTKIREVPDPKSQFKVLFEPLSQIPNNLMEAVMTKNAETKAIIESPYPLSFDNDDAPPARGGRGRAPVKQSSAAPAKKAAGRKY